MTTGDKMKKFETRYITEAFDDATDLTVIASIDKIESRYRFEYFRERWRSKKEAIRFYEWMVKQIKAIPEEK